MIWGTLRRLPLRGVAAKYLKVMSCVAMETYKIESQSFVPQKKHRGHFLDLWGTTSRQRSCLKIVGGSFFTRCKNWHFGRLTLLKGTFTVYYGTSQSLMLCSHHRRHEARNWRLTLVAVWHQPIICFCFAAPPVLSPDDPRSPSQHKLMMTSTSDSAAEHVWPFCSYVTGGVNKVWTYILQHLWLNQIIVCHQSALTKALKASWDWTVHSSQCMS